MPNPTRRGDVIMTSEAPLGRVAIVRTDEPILLAQRIFGMRGRDGVLDSRFLYYALQSTRAQATLADRATGTTVLGIRQPELRKVRLLAPCFSQQQAMADVLGALDDKIAANGQIFDSVDELVSAVARRAQSKSGAVRLGSLLTLNYGKALPASKRRDGSVAVVGSGGVVGCHDTKLIDGPALIVGRKGTVGATHWIDGPAFPIDTTYWVESRDEVPLLYLYYVLRDVDFAAINFDSAVPGVNRDQAYAVEVPAPDPHLITGFSEKTAGLTAMRSAIKRENEILARTRDELLPLLMSGKVTVKQAETRAEEVL